MRWCWQVLGEPPVGAPREIGADALDAVYRRYRLDRWHDIHSKSISAAAVVPRQSAAVVDDRPQLPANLHSIFIVESIDADEYSAPGIRRRADAGCAVATDAIADPLPILLLPGTLDRGRPRVSVRPDLVISGDPVRYSLLPLLAMYLDRELLDRKMPAKFPRRTDEVAVPADRAVACKQSDPVTKFTWRGWSSHPMTLRPSAQQAMKPMAIARSDGKVVINLCCLIDHR